MNEEQRKQLLEAARRLVSLLEDSHPGVPAWDKRFYRTATAMKDHLDQTIHEIHMACFER